MRNDNAICLGTLLKNWASPNLTYWPGPKLSDDIASSWYRNWRTRWAEERRFLAPRLLEEIKRSLIEQQWRYDENGMLLQYPQKILVPSYLMPKEIDKATGKYID